MLASEGLQLVFFPFTNAVGGAALKVAGIPLLPGTTLKHRAIPALDPWARAGHMTSMLIHTETTPNPATLKFLPGQAVMTSGTRDFASPEEAEASPLAEAIFSTGDVVGVFFGSDFIAVTAGPG